MTADTGTPAACWEGMGDPNSGPLRGIWYLASAGDTHEYTAAAFSNEYACSIYFNLHTAAAYSDANQYQLHANCNEYTSWPLADIAAYEHASPDHWGGLRTEL